MASGNVIQISTSTRVSSLTDGDNREREVLECVAQAYTCISHVADRLAAFGNQICLHLLLKLAWCSLGL